MLVPGIASEIWRLRLVYLGAGSLASAEDLRLGLRLSFLGVVATIGAPRTCAFRGGISWRP